jgi:hypothetical protein
VRIESRKCAQQKNHVVADLEFFNRIDPLQTSRLSLTGRSGVEKWTFPASAESSHLG